MVYIILGNGFEEAEALVPCDLLRRAGIETQLAGIGGRAVTGGHGITVTADVTVEEAALREAELVVLPGGLGGVASIRGCKTVMEALGQTQRLAAICAAPSILAELGITDGKRATVYPGMEKEMGAALMTVAEAVTDGAVTTGKAAGAAFAFGLELIRVLRGEQTAREVAHSVYYAGGY